MARLLLWTGRRHGVGITAFFPLASGILGGRYRPGEGAPADSLMAKRKPGGDRRFTVAAAEAVEELTQLAVARGISLPEFCLAWLMQQPGLTAAILGARKLEYLQAGVRACEVTLSAQELAQVDEIVPPGGSVGTFYDSDVYSPMRQEFRAGAKNAGAFIPDEKA